MPGDDLKAALLVFRQALRIWSASEPAPPRPAAIPLAPAPARPEALDRAQAPLARADAETITHVAKALAGPPDELAVRIPRPSNSPPLSPEQATNLAKTLATALAPREAPSAPATASPNSVPPPYRGAPLAAQAPAAPSIATNAAPHDIAERLIAGTDGALARQTLLQIASLPEQPDLPRAEAAQRWSFEVPFATPQGTAIAQFEITRDGARAQGRPADAHMARALFARCRADGPGACGDRAHRRAHQRDAVGRAHHHGDAAERKRADAARCVARGRA